MLHPPHVVALLGEALGTVSTDHALAYIGPGAGVGGIAIAIALFLGVLFLVVGLVWYPMKRLVNGRARGAATGGRADASE